jgi:hypothetical protein
MSAACDNCGATENTSYSDELRVALCGDCYADRADELDRRSRAAPSKMPDGVDLPIRSLGTALAGTPDKPEWYWDGYVGPGNVTLIAGRPKVGKSSFLLGLIGAIGAGQPFVGRATRQTRILLLTEERQSALKPKVERFGVADESLHLLMRHEVSGLRWRAIAEQAATYCPANGIGILVIDTWDKWSGLTGERENSAGDVTEALEPLASAAGQGLGVIIVSHQRKSAGTHGEAIRGSNALAGGVEVVTEVERMTRSKDELDPDARLLKSLSRFDETPAELGVRLVGNSYEPTDRTSLRIEGQRKRIKEWLSEHGELTADAETAKDLKMRKQALTDRMQEMYDNGEVARDGDGRRGSPFRFLPSNSVLGTETTPTSLRASVLEDSAVSVPDSIPLTGNGNGTGRLAAFGVPTSDEDEL